MSKTEAVCSKILVPLALLLVLRLSAAAFRRLPDGYNGSYSKSTPKFNYAAYEAGAKVLAASGHVTGAKGLLQESSEKYMVVPCHFQQEWIEMSLSEDIRLEAVEMVSGEMYSSSFSEVIIEGSPVYPANKWTNLGIFPLSPASTKSLFPLRKRLWLRYLRITFHTAGRSDHYYCCMNRIAVYGSTLLQGLKEELDDTQLRTNQQLNSYKSSQISTSLAPLSHASSSISESLFLIANMQRLRTSSGSWAYPAYGPVFFFNDTQRFGVSEWRAEYHSKPETRTQKSERTRTNESVSVFKKVADQVANTAVKLEIMGDYMSLLEQLSLKTQSKLADLDLSVRIM